MAEHEFGLVGGGLDFVGADTELKVVVYFFLLVLI